MAVWQIYRQTSYSWWVSGHLTRLDFDSQWLSSYWELVVYAHWCHLHQRHIHCPLCHCRLSCRWELSSHLSNHSQCERSAWHVLVFSGFAQTTHLETFDWVFIKLDYFEISGFDAWLFLTVLWLLLVLGRYYTHPCHLENHLNLSVRLLYHQAKSDSLLISSETTHYSSSSTS